MNVADKANPARRNVCEPGGGRLLTSREWLTSRAGQNKCGTEDGARSDFRVGYFPSAYPLHPCSGLGRYLNGKQQLELARLLIAVAAIMPLVVSCGGESPGGSKSKRPTTEVRTAQSRRAVELLLELRSGATWAASIVNYSGETVVVVLPGDGSPYGWRTPIVKWNVVSEAVAIEQHSRAGCGNINALRPDEVIKLRSGESVSINSYGLLAPSLPKSGTASVSLSYVNIPHLEWKGIPLGPHDPETMVRVRASTPLRLMSNTVRLEIEAPVR